MVKASSASRDAKAVWPLFVTLGLLTLLAVVGSPNMGLRGFADGFVLGLSLIVVVLLLFNAFQVEILFLHWEDSACGSSRVQSEGKPAVTVVSHDKS